jgi:uncharacterized protein YidB (DUF937 family)
MAKGYPSMLALLGLVALAGYQNRDKIADAFGRLNANANRQSGSSETMRSSETMQGNLDSLLGGLRGAAAGASGLVRDGLGELMDRFQRSGRGDVARSWVNSGPNQQIAPHELEATIGSDVLAELSQRTGLSRDELLARLSRELPAAVDQYTPEGRLPDA